MPPPGMGLDHSFTLQTILDLQRTAGTVEAEIKNLKEEVSAQRKTLDKIKITLAVASGALLVLGGIAGYIADKAFRRHHGRPGQRLRRIVACSPAVAR